MNKTIIMNISGVIFHIEEDAYEILKNYMNKIKAHFASYRDNFEIITDIENRIAEMFSDLLIADHKQVIVQTDVETVIAKMGNPSDFEDENSEFTSSDEVELNIKRKLYRDIDDRIIGGVCSGIGHYFGVEAKWFRIAFFLLFVLYGFGLLPYILLWIVMPKAKTRAEKMEMKGEKINLHTFQKNFEEELDAVKTKFNDAQEQVKPGLARLGSFIRDILNGFADFLNNTGKVVLKIAGIILITLDGIALVIAFILLLIFLGYAGNTDVSSIFPLNALTPSLRPIIYICSFFVIFIPLLGLLFLILRVIFNNRSIARTVSFSMLMIWIIALATGIFYIAKNATDFKEEASFSESIGLKDNASKTFYLNIGGEHTIQENILGSINQEGDKIITITGNDRDFDTPNRIDLSLNLIKEGNISLTKTYTARGRNISEALKNAQAVEYYYSQKDSLLTFDYRPDLKSGALWRDQSVNLKLNIPVGSTLYIQKRFVNHFLRNEMYDCLNDDDDSENYIKVMATKDGFTCKRTEKAIERQKNYNQENHIDQPIDKDIIF
ncbi:MAG: PspC domain-containing protein [Sphingobacteriales bacterium]|nr:PspC domain-containing protein [Sphingobacteriales bacterium]